MKFPRVLFLFTIVGFGVLASVSALAAQPAVPGGSTVPKEYANLPPYYIAAAGLDDPVYLDCIKKHSKLPVDVNIVQNFDAGLDCRNASN